MNKSIQLGFLAIMLLLSASSQAARCDQNLAAASWNINLSELKVEVLKYDDFYRIYYSDSKVATAEELAPLERIDDKTAHEKGLQSVTERLHLTSENKKDILTEPITMTEEQFDKLKQLIPNRKLFVVTSRGNLQQAASYYIQAMKNSATTSETGARVVDFIQNYINPWSATWLGNSSAPYKTAGRIALDQARLAEIEKTKIAYVPNFAYSTRVMAFENGALYFFSHYNGKWWKVDRPFEWFVNSNKNEVVQISILDQDSSN